MNKPLQGRAVFEQSAAATAFLVAGAHRSGTSALAKVLSLLGAELPRTLMNPAPDNPRGFWESAPIADFNEAVLAGLGSSWDDVLAFLLRREELKSNAATLDKACARLAAEFSLKNSLVLKDPRIALLLDLWMAAVTRERLAPRVLITVRDPLEVCASLHARNGIATGRSLLLWLTYFLAAEKASRGTPRVFVHYLGLLEDWRGAMRRAEAALDVRFAGWTPQAELEIDSFLSQGDRRQHVSPTLLGQRADVVSWVKRAYAWASAAAAAAHAPSVAELDEIAAEFEASLRVFAPIIAEQNVAAVALRTAESAGREQRLTTDAALRRLAQEAQLTAAQRDAALAESSSHSSQAAALALRLRDQEIRAYALTGDVRDRDEQIASLLADVRALEAKTEAQDLTLRERASAMAALESEGRASAAEALAHAKALQAALEQLAATELALDAKTGDLIAADHRVASLAEEVQGAAANEQELERLSTIEAKLRGEAAKLQAQIKDRSIRAAEAEKARGAQAAHILALEQSVRVANVRAQEEAEQRTRFENLASAQAAFIAGSTTLVRRIRRMLWRRPALRVLSYAAEFARLCLRRGPRAAARTLAAAHVLRRSGEFDVAYYLREAWDVQALGQDPAVHYLEAGAAEGRDPSPSFSSRDYLARYPDVARAGANPLLHFVRHGKAEGRVAARIRLAKAAAASPGSMQAPQAGAVARAPTPSLAQPPTPAAPLDLYSIRPDDCVAAEAETGAAFLKRHGLGGAAPDFAGAVAAINAHAMLPPASPLASVIVPVYGQLGYTLNCLDALLAHRAKTAFEVIVVDDCSPDASREWLARVRGVHLHARRQNGGFIEACNDGAAQAQGRWLVFLNNDTRVVEGWLDALMDSFTTLPDAEIVGSKLFFPDGSLQEAGGILWRDGSAWNYGRNDDPGRPEYCYARPVDYVSGASLAIASDVWKEIGGFDTRYKPAYCEDADLCLKIRYARGKQVWMQPQSRVIHYEGKTSGIDVAQGVKAHQVVNTRTLHEVWRGALAAHRPNGEAPLLEKDRSIAKRALVIEATTPEPQKDAGSVTCIALIRALQASGYKVTFAPADNMLFMPQPSGALQAVGVEVLYAPYALTLTEALKARGGEFDLALAFRFGVAGKHIAALRENAPRAPIIMHCSDLHFLREERYAQLVGDSAKAKAAAATRGRELDVIRAVDVTIVHSPIEKQVLAEAAPGARVYVFPFIQNAEPRTTGFQARRDIAFLGGYRHTPNVDAVRHFVERIWPRIHAALPDMRFLVVGSECPQQLLELHGRDNVEVVGFVEDLRDLFAGVRLSVAPIRYGAGIKGKVAVALGHGVPTVLTSCAAEGMGLADGEAVLIRDDEEAFAEAVVALYNDERRWTEMSDRALRFVDEEYGAKLTRKRMAELLALAGR